MNSKKCREMSGTNAPYQVMSEDDEEEEYCYGCESGVDCASAHTERCQMLLMNVSS